ncbi:MULTISPECIES: SDR family NAD(P)-dependent oxidoreductase [Chelativorans]|jgi:NAD(P)-dependent dehydrogenase (short-subunit alcohol dehydrogenase family)|uniref:Short-chain dehydrogenase/reductase SDR n=1 Tax=Chelativorans sp. (strain BNC1) TaxID=266779 RepID=Q11C90_CHESB|nr:MULTISPECIES: SDR family NAD(P)-dependent oxidoreductase [Chelativorans]
MTLQVAQGARFAEKVVLVVGAGRPREGWNNGGAAARAYACEGAQVICADRDLEAAERSRAIIEREGGKAVAIRVDATDLKEMEGLTATILERFGRIDVLHNNIGVTVMGGPVELSEPDYHKALDLNLGTVYRACKAVLPAMLDAGRGAIVNVSSLASLRWTGYAYFAYSAAKAAVNQATVSIAMEYARHGIRANCVIPGAIETPMLQQAIANTYGSPEEMREARIAMVPMRRNGQPEDVAQAALFLASDAARFITGVCLPVDGGQSCSARAFP